MPTTLTTPRRAPRTAPPRRPAGAGRLIVLPALGGALVVLAGAVGLQAVEDGPARPVDERSVPTTAPVLAAPPGDGSAAPGAPPRPRLAGGGDGGAGRGLGREDGLLADGATVFDDVPAMVNLDAALLTTLRRAAADAAGDGVVLYVNSAWRSPAYQEQLLRDAVADHGSLEEAARWVSTPETSQHVSGDAIDIGGAHATAWLSEHGAAYGLCQIYDNEPWHFERRAEAADRGCPTRFSDPTEDPRMQG